MFIVMSISLWAEPVVRLVKTPAGLSLPPSAHGATEVIASLTRLRPNYLVEVVASQDSQSGSPDVLSDFASILDNIPGYVGIPYYSVSFNHTYPLFDKAVVTSRVATGGGASTEALMHMKPFDDYRARYSWERGPDWLTFSGRNLDSLVYFGISAVQPGNMLWYLCAYRSEGRTWFYGIGAVRAFDLLGAVRSKLEPSFVGRTQAFFIAIAERLKEVKK